uniref:NAD_binding_4 domain-containing protein n=1 Tax=Ascaris lumbricoides TaxID=6252 RepID=A0A0M3IGZ4_ASCLU
MAYNYVATHSAGDHMLIMKCLPAVITKKCVNHKVGDLYFEEAPVMVSKTLAFVKAVKDDLVPDSSQIHCPGVAHEVQYGRQEPDNQQLDCPQPTPSTIGFSVSRLAPSTLSVIGSALLPSTGLACDLFFSLQTYLTLLLFRLVAVMDKPCFVF